MDSPVLEAGVLRQLICEIKRKNVILIGGVDFFMEKFTVCEWMKANGLTEDEINFIETIITSTAIQESGLVSNKNINSKVNLLFPNRKFYLNEKINYEILSYFLTENEISIDLKELLNRYYSQGICKEHCKKLLAKV